MEEYGLDSEICLEYIDPSKYNTLPLGTSSKIVYNIGRRDFQKGLHLIKTSTATEFLSVGVAHVGKDECIAENIKKIGLLEFDQYKSLIKDCIYGIFPVSGRVTAIRYRSVLLWVRFQWYNQKVAVMSDFVTQIIA